MARSERTDQEVIECRKKILIDAFDATARELRQIEEARTRLERAGLPVPKSYNQMERNAKKYVYSAVMARRSLDLER